MKIRQISILLVLVSLVLMVFLQSSFAQETIDIQVILSENDGENPIVYYFKLAADSDYTLLQLMNRKFIIEADNGFITSIQDKAASNADKTAWMYTINGEMALIGASDYKIKHGDVFHWDLRKW